MRATEGNQVRRMWPGGAGEPARVGTLLWVGIFYASIACGLRVTSAWAEEAPATRAIASETAAETVGPERLKSKTRVIVDTHVPPTDATPTNALPETFDWDVSWKGWDGLHFALERNTLLGRELSGITHLPVRRLAETRMAGKIGAKLALDAAAYVTGEDFTGFDAGMEVRRARVYARGDCLLLLPVSYEVEIGYVPGAFYIENSYVEFHNLGLLDFLGSLKFGQYQVPMGLVNYGSSRDMMFMEAPSPVTALAPGVNAGVQVGKPVFKERMTWALGMFTDAAGVGSDFGEATKGFGRAVGRVTGLPIYSREPGQPHSQRLLHLGVSGSVVYAGQNSVRYRTRPESHLAPYVVDTGEIDAEGALSLGAEAAWVRGPLCLQGELLSSTVRNNAGQEVNFGGFYSSVSWFLTGESRPYDQTQGTFGRVIPKRNFNFGPGGWGAWEIAGRYSSVNLNRGDSDGGRLGMLMAGVNWYLHPHVKWRFDYGLGHVGGRTPEGNLSLFQTRVELDL